MGRPMRVRALLGVAAVTFTLLAGCARDADPARAAGPSGDPFGDPVVEPPVTEIPDSDPVALAPPRWASGSDAADFARNVAGLDRIRARMRTAAALRPEAIGSHPSAATDPAAQAAAREVWTALGALPGPAGTPSALSRSPARMWSVAGIPEFAEGTTAATFAGNDDLSFHNHITFDGDTSWFVYDDSARGRIHWIHAFHDADGNTHNLVRDSLVFRWPFTPATPVLTASFSRRLNWYGYELCEGLADGDGDGSLNGSAPGTALRQRKEFTVTLGDTAWKSVWLMGHGGSDSAGGGLPVMFADSMFVKGVAVAGTRGSDGDGDGFVFSGPAGAPMVVRTESFHRDAGGLQIHTRGASGPGEDGDFFISGDNPLHPFTVAVLSESGDTLSVHAYGDADADGFYADPRAGAANRVWETGLYLEREGFRTYRDSLVKSLGALGDTADDRAAIYGSHVVGLDGAETRRKDVFGPAQSDWTWEERRYAEGGDSTVITGGLGTVWVIHYADNLPRGARASGRYDTETGRFRDTLDLGDDGRGGGRIREFCDGIHHASAGTADFTLNARPGDGGGTWTRMLLAPDEGGGFAVTAIREPDRDTYRIRGDTVTWKASYGDTLAEFSAIPLGTGGYRVLESVMDGGGGPLAEAEFEFGSDRSGRGSYRDLADSGSAAVEAAVEFVFGAEGSVRRLEAKRIGEASGD